MRKKKHSGEKIVSELSAVPILGQPETAYDMINKYGTYEIQPTSDSGNEFPTISQGLPKE